jgi:peptide/nickel transport system permease protein
MRRYITHRVLQGIVTIWLVTLGVFSVLRLTGDPVSYMLPPDASKEDRARLIALYGFNDPLWKQYLVFNNSLLHGRVGP